ncbi:MAG: CotH kinase family protein [Bacteroidaceae bacterium]|nr:CotH kinase family protein [Bacteroidaceae bacterium]
MMRNVFGLLFFILVSVAVRAEERYYVHFTDGRVWGYPKEMVKEVVTEGDVYSLTLINDSTLVWDKEEVKDIDSLQPVFPQMTMLSFLEDLNDELTDDIDATIDGNVAKAEVASIGRYLTPTFMLDHVDAKAYVDGKEMESGVSRLRFDGRVTYTVALPEHRRLAYRKVADEVWSETGITTEKVTLTADMLSTNAPTSIEGEGLEMMLDGNTSTFFHSTWSKDAVYEVDLTKQVYVQVDLKKAIKEMQFRYVSRPNTDRYNIKEWKIEASADGSSWLEVSTLNEAGGLAVTGQGVDYTSPVITMDKDYAHLRLTATSVGYKNYLCLAELELFEVTGKTEEPTLLKPATYAYSMVPMGSELVVDVDWLTERANSVPRIDIDIDGGEMVTSKDYYLNALITIQGEGVWPDFKDSVQIKGRGNTSWRDFDKKPYRLKFAKSVKPFGWKKGKNWNLLAQAQTGSMMTNPIAMKIARMVEAAAANDVMPVDLYMNGKYLGSYLFTQKTGLANNSVELEDESQAAFLELDKYYDETYKFKSANYALPVNIKEPDLAEGETLLTFEQIQSDFNAFETSVKQNSHFERLVDLDKLVRFMLVNELVLNAELGHPKSVFLYRENLNYMNTTYTFGPVWDFDWAYGYESNRNYCSTGATNDIFANYDTSRPGSRFFSTLWKSSPWVKCLYYRLWKEFMENHLQELLDYVDDYYNYARTSFANNTTVWSDGNGYEANAKRMKQWLEQRANYLMGNLTAYDDGTPIPYTFGDTNNDGILDNGDIQTLLSYLLEENPANFNEEQADIDNDGDVSTNDLAWICSKMTSMEGIETSSLTNWNDWDMTAYENETPLSLTATETTEGSEWKVSASMKNQHPYVACTMDLTLPEGIVANEGETSLNLSGRTQETHIFVGKHIDGNVYRIIGYSPHNLTINGTEGTLFDLSLTANSTVKEGTYPIKASQISFVKSNGEEVNFTDAQTNIQVSANGIETLSDNLQHTAWPADIYDLQGRLVRRKAMSLEGLEKGIYIVNKRKVRKE